MKTGTLRSVAILLFAFMGFPATGGCSSDPENPGSSPKDKDVRYIWPDEGTPEVNAAVEGAPGYFGPHKASLAVEACAIVSSCFDEAEIGECVRTIREYWKLRDGGGAHRFLQTNINNRPPEALSAATQIDCVTNAADCEAVRNCVSSSSPCGGCAGDSIMACRDPAAPFSFKIDCAAIALKCVETAEDFSASCGVGTCNQSGESSCEGGQRSACELGIIKEFDCEAENLVCEKNASETAQCKGKSGPCSPGTDSGVCVGTLARNCIGTGWQEEDCSFLGDIGSHRCSTDIQGLQTAQCIYDGGCDPLSYEAHCSNGLLTFCPAGRPITVDCLALNLGSCVLTPHARCLELED